MINYNGIYHLYEVVYQFYTQLLIWIKYKI
jgi:hypothetical protein